jgi:hypothetical protein
MEELLVIHLVLVTQVVEVVALELWEAMQQLILLILRYLVEQEV